MTWSPKRLVYLKHVLSSSMFTASVELNAGPAYLKAMSDDVHPHGLVAELIGFRLAGAIELPVPPFSVITLSEADARMLGTKTKFRPGPAFVTKETHKVSWDGTEGLLRSVANSEAISSLVTLDTVVRNDDRYPPMAPNGSAIGSWSPNTDNVFITDPEGTRENLRILGIDFGRAFSRGKELKPAMVGIEKVQEEAVYGAFPAFKPYLQRQVVLTSLRTLKGLGQAGVREVIGEVPRGWAMRADEVESLGKFVVDRASFLYDHIEEWLFPDRNGQQTLPFRGTDR